MKLEVQIGGRTRPPRRVELAREGERLRAVVDGQPVPADVVALGGGVYSILLGGQAFEVRVEETPEGLRVHVGGREFSAVVADPRAWPSKRGYGGHGFEAEGRQQVTAPMPGKVVRVLVKAGDAVEAGQGLVVVEAMKMQNEIRSPKTGTVERLAVAEGQAVNAGAVLATVA